MENELHKIKKVIDAGEIIDDWEIYSSETDKPYIVFYSKGSNGKRYRVEADIVSVIEEA